MAATVPASKRMSIASTALDTDGKGYLDDVEQLCRKYDLNGDGRFTVQEVKSIVRDVRAAHSTVAQLKKALAVVVLGAVVACAVLVALMLSANELSKENHTGKDGVLTGLEGNAVQTDTVRSFADMRDFLTLPFSTLEKLDYVTFTTGSCDGSAESTDHVLKVARVERTSAGAGSGGEVAATTGLRLWGMTGAVHLEVRDSAVSYHRHAAGTAAAEEPEEVCLMMASSSAPEVGTDGRRLLRSSSRRRVTLVSEAEHRRSLRGRELLVGSLMTSGSFVMMGSKSGD